MTHYSIKTSQYHVSHHRTSSYILGVSVFVAKIHVLTSEVEYALKHAYIYVYFYLQYTPFAVYSISNPVHHLCIIYLGRSSPAKVYYLVSMY